MLGLIIFGTRGKASTVGDGTFLCPHCRQPRSYKHQRLRRYFSLYFIPLIPLNTIGEYVECQTCHNKFDPKILDFGAS